MNFKNLILALLAALMLTVMPATAVEVRGVPFDQASAKYNDTLSWDAETFPGFWYAVSAGKSSETLKIDQPASSLSAKSREIKQDKLVYETIRSEQKFRVFLETGKKLENGDSSYYRLGWFGDLYVAINGKANKLAKLVKEQKKEEKQTLKLGETWILGEGYNLTIEAIDARASPRQAWIALSKGGKNLDNKVASEGEVYSYIQQNLGGESNVPVFVTYIESVFSGTSEIIQLRYTWLISQNVTEVKTGDKFGVFEVKEANGNHLFLANEKAVNLDQNTVIDLAGGIKFRVADSATALRFYPFKEVKDSAPQTQPAVSATAVINTTSIGNNAIQANLSVPPVQSPILIAEQTPAPKQESLAKEKTVLRKIFGFWGTYAIFAIIVVGAFTLWPERKKK